MQLGQRLSDRTVGEAPVRRGAVPGLDEEAGMQERLQRLGQRRFLEVQRPGHVRNGPGPRMTQRVKEQLKLLVGAEVSRRRSWSSGEGSSDPRSSSPLPAIRWPVNHVVPATPEVSGIPRSSG